MHCVVLTGLINILLQSVLDIAIQALNIEIHILLVQLLQILRLHFDISIDAKERGDLIFLDMDQVLIGQVPKQNVTPLRSVLS